MTDPIAKLDALRTTLLDSRNGYEEAVSQASGDDLLPLFQEMVAHRIECLAELDAIIASEGGKPRAEASFMSVVHRGVIDMRALLSGLDESILPNLIEGEERILARYDETIGIVADMPEVKGKLSAQRERVAAKIARMERLASKAEA